MTDITIAGLTNSTTTATGTGVFDVLMDSVNNQVLKQYEAGRITGVDYATVYLGGLQEVLKQSMMFIMSEQEAGIKADTLQSALEDARNKAQAELEKGFGYAVTRDGTTGNNVLGASSGTGEQDYKTAAAKGNVDTVISSTAKNYAEIALLDQKQITELTRTTNPTGGVAKAEFDKINTDANLVSAKQLTETETTLIVKEQLKEVTSKISLIDSKKLTEDTTVTDSTGGSTKDKADLMAAQTLGFANNTRQSVLKTMLEGYSTNLAISGVANVPEATRDGAIDQLVQNVLDSLTTTNSPVRVQIQTVAETADVDTGT